MVLLTVILLSLSQLFAPHKEIEYQFCSKEKNANVQLNTSRHFFSIQSPNYPKNYGKNKDCSYLFQMNSDSALELHTMLLTCPSKFRLQKKTTASSLCVDYFQVDDSTFCGKDLDANITKYIMKGPLDKNGVLLQFTSDESKDDKGFRCQAIIDKKKSCSHLYDLNLPDNTVEDIIGLNLKRIELSQIDCTSRIKVQRGYAVKIVVKQFNLHPEDGEYCLAVGLEHQFCSKAEGAKNRWPPLSFVVEPHNGFVNVRLLAHSLVFEREIENSAPVFVLQAMLYRGKESAGSATNLIFSDVSKIELTSKFKAPKPPGRRFNRKMMLPVPAPKPEDSCVCWEFPPDNVFYNGMDKGNR